MSYSRWGESNWYAFWISSSPEGKESQILALWHCHGEKEQRLDWTYAELEGADKQWLREHYTGLSDTDLSEAIGIIGTFRMEMESREYRQTEEMVRANPCPENIDVMLDLFMCDPDMSDPNSNPSSVDLLDFLFSLPSELWETRFLERLEPISFETVWQKRDDLLLLLEYVEQFHDKQRCLLILEAWANELSRRIAENWKPPAVSPEKKLLLRLFGRHPVTPASMLEEIGDAMAKLSTEKADHHE